MRMSKQEAVAWAAGLFEGEGWIVLPHSTRGRGVSLWVGIDMTDRDVLEKFAKVMGVGQVVERKRHRTWQAHWKTGYKWTVRGQDAATVLELLLPYFGQRRSARATVVLEEFRAYVAEMTRARICPGCDTSFSPGIHASSRIQVYCSRRCKERVRRWDLAGGRDAYYATRRVGLRT